MNPQPPEDCALIECGPYHPTKVDRDGEEYPGAEIFGAYTSDGEWGLRCPYGAPGDRLWVRETWHRDQSGGCWGYYADFDPPHDGFGTNVGGRKVPAIHMPRWASRLTLEIVSVRVERLQEISEEDAIAEGVTPFPRDSEGDCWTDGTYRSAFEYLWGEIHGWVGQKRARAPWASNPWVWAITFRRLP